VTTVYTWRRAGARHFLETTVGEDGETLLSWRCWVSLEA
jgi:hypothetical protein